MDAGRQKFLAYSGKRWRVGSAEQIRRDREIQFVDQSSFEQRTKKNRASFARDPANFVITPQSPQHLDKIDISLIAQMQSRFLRERGSKFFRHSVGRENQDRRNIGLKNFQLM